MKLGKAAMEALQAEITGCLSPGDELVIAGAVALSGTSQAADREKETLRQFFSRSFLEDAIRLPKRYGVGFLGKESDAWELAVCYGATALYAMGEGGVLSALWKMAEASGTGLRADLRKIPIRQETIEVCERCGLNPYKLSSEGSLLIGIRGGDALVQELSHRGTMAAVVGQADTGNARLLYSGENVRYLERPR